MISYLLIVHEMSFDISYMKRGILRSVTTEAPYIKHM